MRIRRFPLFSLGLPILALGLTPAWAAENVTEIEQSASSLEQILAHPAEIGSESREARVVVATLDPMTAGGWHTHPSPVYLYIEEGTLTMEVEGREPYEIRAGEAVAEPLDAPMRVVNHGSEPVRIIVFQISPPSDAFLQQQAGDGG